MPGPFPGMDPYLEQPENWESFHDRFIFHLGAVLQEHLPRGYLAEFSTRVQLVHARRPIIPDVSLTRRPSAGARRVVVPTPVPDQPVRIQAPLEEAVERYIEVLRVPGRQLVAVIEVASPTNKMDPRGRDAYREKQRAVLASEVHLVEMDLLRSGSHWAAVPETLVQPYQPYHYLACISRAADRREFECYFIGIRERLPVISIPLLDGDADVGLALQVAFDRAYDQAEYLDWLDYSRPPVPPLSPEEDGWLDTRLREAGLRS